MARLERGARTMKSLNIRRHLSGPPLTVQPPQLLPTRPGKGTAMDMTELSADGPNAREAALALVEGAFARRGGLDDALDGALGGLNVRDRAFARNLAMATLRRWGQIEQVLSDRLASPPPEIVTGLLRLGVAQILFTDVPDHAAVATILDMAQARPAARPFKGLLNAVLRGIVRNPPALRDADLAPAWLLARWKAAYGESEALAIAAMIAQEPATDLSLRDPKDMEALEPLLQGQRLPGGTLRAGLRGDLAQWPGFDEGRWWVQDAAAAIPARLIAATADETVLDLCAAPGGKTLQLATTGARVTALDRSGGRLKRLAENLTRARLSAEIVISPAETWLDGRTFDAVLLDAPCSATGTFRRQPEVLWLAKPGEIAKLAMVQARLLDAAARRVRAGGRLVYCVCSLEPEEGEAQASSSAPATAPSARSASATAASVA
ncbi:MAG: RsmB/NOP family class I SAM-dependent RNA methyltransferase [Alphaproteobacteria bacterium]